MLPSIRGSYLALGIALSHPVPPATPACLSGCHGCPCLLWAALAALVAPGRLWLPLAAPWLPLPGPPGGQSPPVPVASHPLPPLVNMRSKWMSTSPLCSRLHFFYTLQPFFPSTFGLSAGAGT